jgi:hypothetical protein
VGQALDAYLAGMEDGTILDRSGKVYKPATCRSYRRAAELRLKPEVGHYKLGELRRRDVQDLVNRLRIGGGSPSTIANGSIRCVLSTGARSAAMRWCSTPATGSSYRRAWPARSHRGARRGGGAERKSARK